MASLDGLLDLVKDNPFANTYSVVQVLKGSLGIVSLPRSLESTITASSRQPGEAEMLEMLLLLVVFLKVVANEVGTRDLFTLDSALGVAPLVDTFVQIESKYAPSFRQSLGLGAAWSSTADALVEALVPAWTDVLFEYPGVQN